MLQKISTDKAPAAIGPYSQGIIVNGMLFASGQIPINPATGNVEGEDITQQAELVMKNVGAILAEAGTDYTKVPFLKRQEVILARCSKPLVSCRIWEILRRSMKYMPDISQRSRPGAAWR